MVPEADSAIQEAYDKLLSAQNRISGVSLIILSHGGAGARDLMRFVEEMHDAEFALTNALLDAGVIE